MCGSCGGGSGSSSPGVTAWSPTPGTPEVYEVTYPDGTTEQFGSQVEAYSAIAGKGGGVRQVA